MANLFPKNTIVKTPPYFFEHNKHNKYGCKFCNKMLDFKTVSKDLYAYSIMYYSEGSKQKWICKNCFEKFSENYKLNIEEYDWRITGNESYLVGKNLKKVDVLEFYAARVKEWDGKDERELHDHDHCSFCLKTIMIETADENPFAYSADDCDYWICEECYNDFKEKFKWEIEE